MVCKVCGGSDFLMREGIVAYCLDCGIEYDWDDALALEQDCEISDRDEYIENFMKNYDLYYDKYYIPMQDSIDKDAADDFEDESTDWKMLDSPSPFDAEWAGDL
ncbi:MAG: hypothetical protein E7300_08700 [Lachnospiraceae bacterium]|nr:hypothetical protein [Lachnospiraceae bacterium]